MDIIDVRKELWTAYQWATNQPDFCGKISEAYCEIVYPGYWDVSSEEEFLRPIGLMVYSYALGPSRRHWFYYGKGKEDYCTWYSEDPFKKAVEVIQGWVKEYDE
jgi:hypothetical protein